MVLLAARRWDMRCRTAGRGGYKHQLPARTPTPEKHAHQAQCRTLLTIHLSRLPALTQPLDPQKQHAVVAGYVFGIALACILIFSLARLIEVLKFRLFSVGRSTRRRAGRGHGNGESKEALEEWETVFAITARYTAPSRRADARAIGLGS